MAAFTLPVRSLPHFGHRKRSPDRNALMTFLASSSVNWIAVSPQCVQRRGGGTVKRILLRHCIYKPPCRIPDGKLAGSHSLSLRYPAGGQMGLERHGARWEVPSRRRFHAGERADRLIKGEIGRPKAAAAVNFL